MYLGIGLGPLACEGHEGEKWSFAMAQQGHINQCEWYEVGFFVLYECLFELSRSMCLPELCMSGFFNDECL